MARRECDFGPAIIVEWLREKGLMKMNYLESLGNIAAVAVILFLWLAPYIFVVWIIWTQPMETKRSHWAGRASYIVFLTVVWVILPAWGVFSHNPPSACGPNSEFSWNMFCEGGK
jgi:hypothetical protein